MMLKSDSSSKTVEKEINIGRSPDSTCCIISAVISRHHATITKQEDNTWVLIDNNSVNGVAVNGTRLEPSVPHLLRDGDLVMFGVPKTPDAVGEFVYRFFSKLKVRKETTNKGKRQRTENIDSDGKRLRRVEKDTFLPAASVSGDIRSLSCVDEEDEFGHGGVIKRYKEKLHALAAQVKEKEAEKMAIQQQLQTEREQRYAIELVQKEQEDKVSQLDAKQRQLQEEKAAVEFQIQRELETKYKEKEDMLRQQMCKQLADLAAEKKNIEEHLQKEMEKTVQEKDKELHDCLQKEKERLQKVIEMKELEQKALESQLAQSKLESEKAKSDTFSTRDAILQDFAETMETELQCSICSELFIQATSLNCAHAFCALCIRQWLAVKKECPVCRAEVTSQVRSYVLDNYIDRMVEQLNCDLKKRRADLVAERKEAQAKYDETERKEKAGPSGTPVTAGRGGVRRRGAARGRGRGQVGRGRATATRVLPLTASTASAVNIGQVSATDIATTSTSSRITTPTTVPSASIRLSHDSVDAVDSVAAEPIVVSDVETNDSTNSDGDHDDDVDDDDDDDDDSFDPYHTFTDTEEDSDGDYVLGNRGAYYGGYGRCFKCGSRGHWANGCPF